ncbi:Outer membrane protein beta-barrel domain-containing protein [Flavobacterium defluvii]|uniref:Outer membrane protein beta-barrel domain-containing protein n=2 Tax=Flavobacterium defluvii TaxID=370979 RepID=A0A1M5V509_9FLAO|nr:Outer membrane protein beta-barrel domain-containing protein [Flavobacterium defluvii]
MIMMKKLLLAAMLTVSTFAFSQGELFGTIGMTKFSEKDNGQKFEDHKGTLSGKLGFTFWIPFEDARFSINPGITYGNMGTKFKDSNDDTTVTLGYVSVPVDFVYKIKPIGSTFFFSGGGYYGYLTSAETQYGELKINDGDYSYKRSDYGVNVGAGYFFGNGITLRLTYSQGLANIMNYPTGVDDSHIKNSNFGLSVGYILFKKRI